MRQAWDGLAGLLSKRCWSRLQAGENARSEKGERTFRDAVIDDREMTLWVINCCDAQWLARQLCPIATKPATCRYVETGHFLPRAPAARQQAISSSDRGEVRHTPAV